MTTSTDTPAPRKFIDPKSEEAGDVVALIRSGLESWDYTAPEIRSKIITDMIGRLAAAGWLRVGAESSVSVSESEAPQPRRAHHRTEGGF